MARFDKDIGVSRPQPLSAEQTRALLGLTADGEARRTDAVACFLAGAEGWEAALRQVGGAFADGESGLKDDQSE